MSRVHLAPPVERSGSVVSAGIDNTSGPVPCRSVLELTAGDYYSEESGIPQGVFKTHYIM